LRMLSPRRSRLFGLATGVPPVDANRGRSHNKKKRARERDGVSPEP
jgi:hypothetical protein